MKTRCSDTSGERFKNYGARGIEVCRRWGDSFEAFFEDMGERLEGHTLDRVNNNGNYEPSNCHWATWSEQALNRRERNRNEKGQFA